MNTSENPIGNPEVVLREEFDEWAVLFNPDTADAVGINPVGVTIWKLMDGKHSVEEIIKEIRDRFADVPENSFEHVASFVNSLADKGFVGYELKGHGK
jgi:SynChlorMet cassette protein ScmD